MGYKICYIDDQQDQINEFRYIFEESGHEFHEFLDNKNGDFELIEYLKTNLDVDLVLIDYKLPVVHFKLC